MTTARKRLPAILMLICILGCCTLPILAQPAQQAAAPTTEDLKKAIDALQKQTDIVWTIIAGSLVFFMQAGFAMVESGFTRAKNAGNIMMKNLLDFCMGGVAYWAVGFGLMFGVSNGFIGMSNFLVNFDNTTVDGQWGFTFWFFQIVFAATAATIVSGAMAERTKFSAYLVYSFIISLLIYPVFGHWAWGNLLLADNAKAGAWLANKGFIDYAGSTVVHSVGGWAALAGAIVVGPRLGRYGKDGKAHPIPGHSLTMAALGVFILYLGWFGFNPGSTTAANGLQSRIAVNTLLAGCTGALTALALSWVKFGKPDIGMTLNGVLAGLVAITAPCATVTPLAGLLIGGIAGVLVVYSVMFFDKVKIDDPVGAISVHGVCGAFGTISAALFHENLFLGKEYDMMGQLTTQLMGVGTAFAWSFGACFLLFQAIKLTVGLRVSADEELQGLDLSEHAANCYPDFAVAPAGGGVSISGDDKPSTDRLATQVRPAEG
ncbi:ammonium transporter [uncultured Paludibaculum sp.]|uniref:ammonium transporter n=1 Tax=uncultured Paludibaculum sp. TaxID=1765020 RepID=UPI002AAC04A5|nr:ammonium transporter [uncultured Paludibaculum sp.]